MGRSFNKWAARALMAGWVGLAGGCAAPAAPATTPAPAPPLPAPKQAEEIKRFIIAPELEAVLHVVSVRLIHPEGALLKIQVNLQNRTQVSQWFRYRIEWFDSDGDLLRQADRELSPWMLMAGEMSSIVATAPSPVAADFEIAFVPVDKRH
jgi:hypothetical protein